MLQRNDLDWRKELISPDDERLLLGDLLAYGYGLAAAVAAMAVIAGAGFWTSLLILWLGGAASVFALGLVMARRKPMQTGAEQAEFDDVDRGRSGTRDRPMPIARAASTTG